MKGVIASRMLEAFMIFLAIYAFYKHDLLWGFACIIGFIISISPILIKGSIKFNVPWIMEFLLAFAISLHIWGGALGLYAVVWYDKFAHFLASGIVAFFALIVVYVLDVYSIRIHMDLPMLAFFIIIFTIAMGAIWEIAEFASDQIFSHGIPVAQISLQDTMTDLIADSIAGILVGIFGAIGIRRGEFKELLFEIGKEVEKAKKQFLRGKETAMNKLHSAMYQKKVDEKAIPIIEKLNEMADFFTTSSCSGRIALLEIPLPGRKRKAKFLGKWHHEISMEDVEKALGKAKNGELWFLVQSPIFHVFTISLKNAKALLHAAIQSGFKYSSIKSINGKVMVEILSTEKMDVPIGKDGKIFVSKEYLSLLTEIA
ncbi:MAG: hypothetical protein J7K12_00520, partial [Thermoplasmata archaeon]|nr:hypothetical protein [Thermoplasmata archaeon]